MGNLGSHHSAGVRTAIEAAGVALLYLPPYRPHFNPIDKAFAKLNAKLGKAAARAVDTLWAAAAQISKPSPQPSAPTSSHQQVPIRSDRIRLKSLLPLHSPVVFITKDIRASPRLLCHTPPTACYFGGRTEEAWFAMRHTKGGERTLVWFRARCAAMPPRPDHLNCKCPTGRAVSADI